MPLTEQELRDRWKTEQGKKCLREALQTIKEKKDDWQKALVGLPGVEDVPSQKDLRCADIHDTDLRSTNLKDVDLSNADIYLVKLHEANLRRAKLVRANLGGAKLVRTNLVEASLVGANLSNANLSGANLSGADLSDAELVDAHLGGTDLHMAILNGAHLGRAKLVWTKFINVDLSEVHELNTCRHYGPSSIGIDTIYNSKGKIPRKFLKATGIPDNFIEYIYSLVDALEVIQFYSCFISYSSRDDEFANQLYAELQEHDIRCWFAPENLKIGERIRPAIDQKIRQYDKLLLILSKDSIESQWVEQEVETALEKERRDNSTVLFPIRLDDSVFDIKAGWATYLRNSRNIGDFTEWKNHDKYEKSFDRLIRDLKASEKEPKNEMDEK